MLKMFTPACFSERWVNESLINVCSLSLMLVLHQSLYLPASLLMIPTKKKHFQLPAIVQLPGIYALKIKKGRKDIQRGKKIHILLPSAPNAPISHLPALLTPCHSHPHANAFHHTVLCRSQDDSSQRGFER